MSYAPSNATLDGFIIDGETLINPRVSRWPGVYANAVTGFEMSNCEVHHFHDEMRFAAKEPANLRARVTDCILRDAWPFTDLGSTLAIDETDFGHAHAWVIGTGGLGVTFLRTTFLRAHDGIETAPMLPAGNVSVTVSDCSFVDTENGLEIVDNGVTTYTADNSDFVGCHNVPPPFGGQDIAVSTGAVVDRSTAANIAEIRGCDFRNFGWGIATSASTVLDMGTAASLGLNNFCLDFSLFTDDPFHASIGGSDNPYRVALFNRSTVTVTAEGNFWVRNSQFASPSGFMTISSASGTGINMPNTTGLGGTPAEPGPPGPHWKQLKDDLVTPWERNYSIKNGTITFGAINPGTGPDCSSSP